MLETDTGQMPDWGQSKSMEDIDAQSSARAHTKGEDDALVRVRLMLDRVDRSNAYLSDAIKLDKGGVNRAARSNWETVRQS